MSDLVSQHQAEWRELQALLARAQRSLAAMSPAELSRLDVLYRQATIHLARANTKSRDPALVSFLNSLTAQAHSLIYVSPRSSLIVGAVEFLLVGFARCIARNWKLHLASAAIFYGAGVFGHIVSRNDLRASYALSTPGDVRTPGSTPEQLQDVLRGGRGQGHGELFLFAAFLFQNNLKVSLMAMATGVLAGIPTVLILSANGLHFGQFTAMHTHSPALMTEMWAWILPHGIPELTAIVFSGGAGLMLGWALLQPGRLTREESLRQAGLEAGKTAIGVALMLFIAALIESYLRQSTLSTVARLWFAGVTGVMWCLYFANGWWQERRATRAVVYSPALEAIEG
jgi:uncharacterized membrane protein SpoIIM required for sporulation